MSTGVLYVATGTRYVEEACRSAASLKQFHPTWSITLFTDRPLESSLFQNIIPVAPDVHSKLNRIACLAQSPYDATLALDTDTYICAPLGDLFNVLEQFDLAATHAPLRRRKRDMQLMAPVARPFPESLVQLNSGVLLYRNSPVVAAFLAEWLRLYERDAQRARSQHQTSSVYRDLGDQRSLLEAFYYSSVRLMLLPSEYNCVFGMPGYLGAPARILHGRHPNPALIAACLNSISGPRVHTLNGYRLNVSSSNGEKATYQTLGTAGELNEYRKDMQDSLERRGIGGTMRYAAFRLERWQRRLRARFKSVELHRD